MTKMKPNAPWSVKGIERDARETAKEAAKREGLTVGEWLNQIIYTAGTDEESSGEIEGLKLRDLVTAIEHLNKRIGTADAKSDEALGGLSRNIGNVVERIQRLERVKPVEGSVGDIAQRVDKLEKAGGDRHRIEALKALEKAVSHVATQFNTAHKSSVERLDANERQLQTLAARIDKIGDVDGAGSSYLQGALEGLSARVTRAETIAAEAFALKQDAIGSMDPSFVERTGERLRILGDEIKRGGDHIKDLESTITKLSSQIDDAERRSAEGVQKVSDTVSELRDEFSDLPSNGVTRAEIDAAITVANQETEEDIASLQSQVESILDRINNNERKNTSATTTEDNTAPETGPGQIANVAPSLDGASFQPSESENAIVAALTQTGAFEQSPPKTAEKETSAEPTETDENTEVETDENQELAPSKVSEDKNTNVGERDGDPFAFADEIEAAIEEPSQSGDYFSFDLDDDESPNEGTAVLSEVQEVFGKREKETSTPEPAGDDESEPDAISTTKSDEPVATFDNDLDAALSDLDEISDDQPKLVEAKADVEKEIRRDVTKAMLYGSDKATKGENQTAPDDGKVDLIQTARQRAKDAAKLAEEDKTKPTRRKLTPKQRAILAARARQKRLTKSTSEAEKGPIANKVLTEQSADIPTTKTTEPAAKKADGARPNKDVESKSKSASKGEAETDAEQSKRKSASSTIAASKNQEPTDADSAATEDRADNKAIATGRAVFRKLKSTVAARPVTLALGAAIVLAAVALFFLVSDLVTKSPPTNIARPTTTSTVDTGNKTAAVQDPQSLENVPAPEIIANDPIIDPRMLYLDAVTTLRSATTTNEETSAAIQTLEEAAALGHPPAQLQLGELYKTGQGVEQDLGQARTWFRRSANGGNVLAMHRIGVMTARGDGGPADMSEAIGWFERAGHRGLVDSQYNLGAIFHPTDTAVASAIQDPEKAYFWFSLASMNGDEQAAPLAEAIASQLSVDQLSTVDTLIADWVAEPTDAAANEMSTIN